MLGVPFLSSLCAGIGLAPKLSAKRYVGGVEVTRTWCRRCPCCAVSLFRRTWDRAEPCSYHSALRCADCTINNLTQITAIPFMFILGHNRKKTPKRVRWDKRGTPPGDDDRLCRGMGQRACSRQAIEHMRTLKMKWPSNAFPPLKKECLNVAWGSRWKWPRREVTSMALAYRYYHCLFLNTPSTYVCCFQC